MYFKDVNELAELIDHTLLKPEATQGDIERVCEEAIAYGFFSVCVNPWWVKTTKEKLKGSRVRVCSVVGFPFGMSRNKAEEAKRAINNGADELDMVLAIGALKSRLYEEYYTSGSSGKTCKGHSGDLSPKHRRDTKGM